MVKIGKIAPVRTEATAETVGKIGYDFWLVGIIPLVSIGAKIEKPEQLNGRHRSVSHSGFAAIATLTQRFIDESALL